MLPSAKNYLLEGGLSSHAAAYTLIGCFLAGVIGIQVVSHFLHHYIPSHVVDCDHTHEDHEEGEGGKNSRDEEMHHDNHSNKLSGHVAEDTPLLSRGDCGLKSYEGRRSRSATETFQELGWPSIARRPSFPARLTSRVSTLVLGAKASCDENGPCKGYSSLCGQECLKAVNRSPTRTFTRLPIPSSLRQPTLSRSTTTPFSHSMRTPLDCLDEESNPNSTEPRTCNHSGKNSHSTDRGQTSTQSDPANHSHPSDPPANPDLEGGERSRTVSTASTAGPPHDPSQSHHHHVPTNAFLSIGLQTSIAIALHKLPEGFITFATNHANPELGFAVFLALFIHNITEGFAMALPLYLALGSRWKAMFWSSLLGGISQPLGAGVAALWFKVARGNDMAPGQKVYGVMFAVTAGIMSSVALQLFSEGLDLTHNRSLCIAFAFVGMGILGVSFALTA
ncbi:hypothetical protein MMC12_000123 [Toensbergia leucococca]|nr:hypothetical protein [Toensbergia leucococca]